MRLDVITLFVFLLRSITACTLRDTSTTEWQAAGDLSTSLTTYYYYTVMGGTRSGDGENA